MVSRTLTRATVELKALVPTRWRLEVALARMAATRHALGQCVVGGALLLVAQHVVGLVDVTHAGLGISLLADVGVVLAGQFAVGLAHILFRGRALDAKRFVVVLEFHRPSMRAI